MTPADAPIEAQDDSRPADTGISTEPAGFGGRGRARRRARFLRKARELAYRDLGGLVFNLHRFGQRNDALVMAKLTTLAHIDAELRTLEAALAEGRPVTVLREAGITACARCAAIHSSEDNFCPNCGLSMGRHVDLPAGFQAVAGAAVAPAVPAAPSPEPQAPGAPPTRHAPAPHAHAPQVAAPPAAAPPSAAPPATPPAAAPQAAAPQGAEPQVAASLGRSPTPPGTPPAAAPPAQAEPPSPGGEESTEIVRPPTVSQ